MQYLIDGHNLIGKMADISLSDPDDEVQMVLRLRSWTAARKKRKVIVIFDGGIPGGKSVNLSTPSVKVIFASAGRTADSLLINRIHKLKNPQAFRLVTSDQQIIAAAKQKRVPVIRSDEFATRLDAPPETPQAPPAEDNPVISDKEVDEWLDIFGPVPEIKRKKVAKKKRPLPPKPKKKKRPLTQQKRSNSKLDDDDLAEWLALFGEE